MAREESARMRPGGLLMQKENRNDKQHQRQLIKARSEAVDALESLGYLLAGPGKENGVSVGELVSIAASLGLLDNHQKEAG